MDNECELNGLRVLITQSVLERLGGSEIQAYELAKYLQSVGCVVTLYVWEFNNPMRKIFSELNFPVITKNMADAEKLSIEDFDILWVQHNVLPISILRQLAVAHEQGPLIIFSHMSPYRELYIEQPYMSGLEDAIADLVVCNSEGTLDIQREYLSLPESKLSIYPNPAPLEFVRQRHEKTDHLSKVLVVSNHPPIELVESAEILREQGVNVDFLKDVVGCIPTITSPEILNKYDCVVSIGKTVQYCLVQGIPVYLYDHFGGPGYLSEQNFEIAAYYNFSGRMNQFSTSLALEKDAHIVDRKDPVEISYKIQNGLRAATAFHQKYRSTFVEKYGIGESFARVLSAAQRNHQGVSIVSQKYSNALVRQQQMISDFYETIGSKTDSKKTFYQQQIQVFYSDTEEMSEKNSEISETPLNMVNRVSLDTNLHGYYRIDFGELPTCISHFRVEGSKDNDFSVSANTPIFTKQDFVFLSRDPQIILHFEKAQGNVIVNAEVTPLESLSLEQSEGIIARFGSANQEREQASRRQSSLKRGILMRSIGRVRQFFSGLIKGSK